MGAVTQLISPFTGGVSSMPDELKRPGQVVELINGITDPSFGLMKRSGLQFYSVLENVTGDISNGHWFFINRNNTEVYFGVVTKEDIQVWNAIPNNLGQFAKATVDKSATGVSGYLDEDGIKPDTREPNYDVLTVQDRTYIVNRQKTVLENLNTPYTLKARATVVLIRIDDLQPYTVTINGVACTWAGTTEFPDQAAGEAATSAETVLTAIKGAIEAQAGNAAMPANLQVQQLATTLEITADDDFEIDVEGGADGVSLQVFQDEVGNVSRLPATTIDGRLVKIINTADVKDEYFVKFEANDGVSGTGIWKESRGWDTDENDVTTLTNDGLNNLTMPFELFNDDINEFTVRSIDYTDRLVGNSLSNSAPSFVNRKLSKAFVYGNRFGFLSDDNVILSQTGEFENFYFTSAQTVTDSDPVDISTSSLRPAPLHAVVPQTEGLVLFSDYEQFILFSEDGNLTPTDSLIRSISNFQNSVVTEPQKIGNNIYFLNSGRSQMKCYGMATRGAQRVSSTVDIGKVASDYISKEIDYFRTDPQNSTLILSSRVERDVYMYRYFNNGERDVMQAWFKWQLPGEVQTFAFTNDIYFFIVKNGSEYVLGGVNVGKSPTNNLEHPCADFFTPATGVSYDRTNDRTMISIPFSNQTELEPVVIYGPAQTRNIVRNIDDLKDFYTIDADQEANEGGYLLEVTREAGEWWVKGDYSGQQNRLTVAWESDFIVDLPKVYYRDPRSQQADYTASLVLSRYKFSCGASGQVEFFTKQRGAEDWNSVQPVTTADYYLADNIPAVDEAMFTLPLYQRNTNFDTRIVASSPFPFTLNSMT